MTSYNLLNGVHTAQRRDLIQDILRSEFGFDGLVMTDWVVGAMMSRKADRHPAVVQHLTAAAGSDLFMPGSSADYKDILSAVKSGDLSRKQLEITATRLLRAGRKLAGSRQSDRQ
jgi:beta-glucosidase